MPPPILSRVYQELSNAMLGFNSAMKVATTPFPFPYAQLNVIQAPTRRTAIVSTSARARNHSVF